MVDFKELLVLIYLNDYKDEYLFTEIKQLCNFTTSQMKQTLDKLIEKGLLLNQDGSLILGSKGEVLLKEKGLTNVSIEELFQMDTVTLSLKKTLSFDDVFIPKNFKL
ncbi:MarR family transcriptional regulator [Alkalihalobacillus pseudalcaliphilus]|uniref:MarR family transcriptional regulator n=1 Tax=Alkalihalobacillus pseudalcaliphilus TaxID=79884 RepID=UPI00064D81FB|nr:MarR family transcriptional regulator [Alkalihalobacillus pseudalcaliphilus]KMK75266.1 hypothetical protein AB990_17760 [Alkalihalobacillus pseudalcaliphilus]